MAYHLPLAQSNHGMDPGTPRLSAAEQNLVAQATETIVMEEQTRLLDSPYEVMESIGLMPTQILSRLLAGKLFSLKQIIKLSHGKKMNDEKDIGYKGGYVMMAEADDMKETDGDDGDLKLQDTQWRRAVSIWMTMMAALFPMNITINKYVKMLDTIASMYTQDIAMIYESKWRRMVALIIKRARILPMGAAQVILDYAVADKILLLRITNGLAIQTCHICQASDHTTRECGTTDEPRSRGGRGRGRDRDRDVDRDTVKVKTCDNFNGGRHCRYGKNCRFAHVCKSCDATDHGAKDCKDR